MEKRPPRAKKTKAKTESENFEDVARKLFKVAKSEITPKSKKD
jgi:hypothetical protein